jgi:hypothetical protein
MKNNLKKISECKFEQLSNGHVAVLFVNYKTGEMKAKEYKNMAAAQAQVTKFQNRMFRIYK